MATSEDTLNRFMKYIDDDHITTRKMMGEYIIYFDNAKQMIHYPNIEDSETILKVVKQVKNDLN